jgi:hypothetical protein
VEQQILDLLYTDFEKALSNFATDAFKRSDWL